MTKTRLVSVDPKTIAKFKKAAAEYQKIERELFIKRYGEEAYIRRELSLLYGTKSHGAPLGVFHKAKK